MKNDNLQYNCLIITNQSGRNLKVKMKGLERTLKRELSNKTNEINGKNDLEERLFSIHNQSTYGIILHNVSDFYVFHPLSAGLKLFLP